MITNYTKSKEKRILQGSNENPKYNYVNCLIPGKKGGWLDQRWSFSSESDFLREWQEFSGPIIKVIKAKQSFNSIHWSPLTFTGNSSQMFQADSI